jgi:3-dehydrotetronate 4-kinase
MTALRIGCIADDFTGATDLANNLVRGGMRTIVTIGIPDDAPIEADAVVVALKTRTAPVHEAVSMSLRACRALKASGAHQIYFKICSTFDSTSNGNIGPVIEALMEELGCAFSVVVPAFPDNGRTVYQGYLFVHGTLLSESSMRHHPLTPMTDSNLVRVLTPQLSQERQYAVGLLSQQVVADSEESLRRAMKDLQLDGAAIAIADTVTREDMTRLAAALHDAPLVTASSGLGGHLPKRQGFVPSEETVRLPLVHGRAAILAGSCSEATNRQVQHFLASGGRGLQLDTVKLAQDANDEITQVVRWAREQWEIDSNQPLLIYSTSNSQSLVAIHERFRADYIGSRVEYVMGQLAIALMQENVRQLVVAGGETSGACIRALKIPQLYVGPQIDPGVPWCYADVALGVSDGLHLALKSGNFGSDEFFRKAFTLLGGLANIEAAS